MKEKLQKILNEKASKKKTMVRNQLQLERDIIHPLSLAFDKDDHLFVSTKEGEIFKIKVEEDLVSLSGVVIAEISLNSGLLYVLAFVNEKLYAASHADNGGIYVVNFLDGTFEKVARNGNECFRVHSLTMFENSLMFTDTGDHSIKVFNPVTGECIPYLAHGKGTREGKSAQFVQPAGLIAERRTVFIAIVLRVG